MGILNDQQGCKGVHKYNQLFLYIEGWYHTITNYTIFWYILRGTTSTVQVQTKELCKELCTSFFNQMTIDDHRLNDMIPEKRLIIYNLREQSEYPLLLCKTNIYKNTLISWGLFNCQ